mmetsp:Transcript_22822/g.36309  ORF Transcript_22822/g.36309 Transcript_22822/m.36309 type:complete len:675 (+) Transcript_22822:163-2187(+)
MKNATKVFLESIQVARHVGRMGARPIEKAAVQLLSTSEQGVKWVLKQPAVQDVVPTKQVWDRYLQSKDVLREFLASASHESFMHALQSGSQAATKAMHSIGLEGRVIGPFDEHWNMSKVIKDLKTAADEMPLDGDGHLRLTPKRFVQFMREAERKKKRSLARDPIEAYVDRLLNSGSLSGLGPVLFEKKLYKDLAGIICFAFDQALVQADGAQLWGHELQIKRRRSSQFDAEAFDIPPPSSVSTEQVEAVVDQMLLSENLRVLSAMQPVQKKLLVNCSVMVLQLLEYLTSNQRMQVTVLGHSLRFRLEPLPLEQILAQSALESGSNTSESFIVNGVAVDELVEALLDEPDTQLIFVPDLLEAEVYRVVLHRMICIAQGMIKSVRLTLFGLDIRFNLIAAEPDSSCPDNPTASETASVNVLPAQLQTCLDKLEDERKKINRELQKRQEDIESRFAGRQKKTEEDSATLALAEEEEEMNMAEADAEEYKKLAAQDRLARHLFIAHDLKVPIEVAYRMLADFDEYPKWMPFCTNAKTIKICENETRCEVAFGLETGTILGAVGDNVRYKVSNVPPAAPRLDANETDPSKGPRLGLKTARVVCDAVDGFAYGKRLVWDWRFAAKTSGETAVQLNILFQAKGVLTLPIWDSLQAMITGVMFKKFTERAAILKAESAGQK